MASALCASFLLVFSFGTDVSAQASSRITVTKDFCASVGQQNTCNGVPASFPSNVTFDVEIGTFDTVTMVFTPSGTSADVVVAIGANANGSFTTGDIFTSATWLRVCENVPNTWQAIPRPENSTGGSQQFAQNNCLIALLGPGNNSLKFINGPGGPTAADGIVSGRVLDANGFGISRIQLRLIDGETGELRTALTNPFGYYTFQEVETGRLYVITVAHKRYRFDEMQRVISLGESALNVDFTALPSL